MPRVSEMFQKAELSFTDFEPGVLYTGTITGVTMKAARIENRGNSMAPPAQTRPGGFAQPKGEIDWLIWFAEYDKPMRLRPQRAKLVQRLLGSDVTEDWHGKKIGWYRGTVYIGSEEKEGIIFDQRPVPQLPAPDGKYLDRARLGRVVPKADVERFVFKLKESGRTWTAFVNWVKDKCPEAHTHVVGRDFDEIPAVVLPAMKTFLDRGSDPSAANSAATPSGPMAGAPEGGLNRLPPDLRGQMTTAGQLEQERASKPPATGEVIDPKTGDVKHAPIDEDDIPF